MFSIYGNAPVAVGKVEESAIVAGSGTISELKLSARGVLPAIKSFYFSFRNSHGGIGSSLAAHKPRLASLAACSKSASSIDELKSL